MGLSLFYDFFFGIALVFDAIALAFVLYAGLELLQHIIRTPKNKKTKMLHDQKYHAFRRVFIHRVILALDFFLIADLTKLAFIDTIPGLIQILFIVVIRSILSYFLLRETGDI